MKTNLPVTSEPISGGAAKRGCGRWFLAGFFFIFLVMGSVAVYAISIRPALKALSARSWHETPCSILTSSVKTHDGSDGATYSLDISYSYSVGDFEYRSNQYDFSDGSSSSIGWREEAVANNAPGTSTVCYVNPDDPTDAVLYRGMPGDIWFGLIPLVFVLVGLVGVIASVRWGRASRRGETDAQALAVTAATFAGRGRSTQAASAASIGRTVLEPKTSPGCALTGVIAVALFWNGIVSVFVIMALQSWRRGQPEWFLNIFLIPFVLVGLGLIVAVFYSALAMFNPHPRLTISSGSVPIGGTLNIEWEFTGRVERITHMRIYFEGREEATYTRGTSTYTDKSVFATIEIADRPAAGWGGAMITIPSNTMPSFKADHNKIIWTIHVKGDINRWPDVDAEFELLVTPKPLFLR